MRGRSMRSNPNEVGYRIFQIRSNMGISQIDFGKKIDEKVHSAHVSNWETGKHLPNKKRLIRIAELGNTTVDQLLSGGENVTADGVNHMQMFVTEEEKVVIDALRAGATARINWFDLTYEEIVRITDELPEGVLTTRETKDFYNADLPFVVVEASSKKVELNLYVDLRQKKH